MRSTTVAEAKKKYRNEEHLTMVDYLRAGFQGDGVAQSEYLQNQADSRATSEEARRRDEEMQRRAGRKARKEY